MRTMKEELVWLREWKSPKLFYDELEQWIERYNSSYLHSALGYQSSQKFEDKINKSKTHMTHKKHGHLHLPMIFC